jgi:hypothetical protein
VDGSDSGGESLLGSERINYIQCPESEDIDIAATWRGA